MSEHDPKLNILAPIETRPRLDRPDPVAAHAWINHLCDPAVAVTEMEYHNYPIPTQAALDQTPAELKNDPLFNVPTSYTDHYKFILNPSQEIVNARTQIYTAFQSA